jgi:abnormal spindle-like microcephaly-associated protein
MFIVMVWYGIVKILFTFFSYFSRVVELLSQKVGLCAKLRLPAQSRLQRVHNVDLALNELRKGSKEATMSTLPADITARSVVDGHREKTLALLWHLVFHFQLAAVLDEDRLREELAHLEKSLRYRVSVGDLAAKRGAEFLSEYRHRDHKADQISSNPGQQDPWDEDNSFKLLLSWIRLVCAHYGVEVRNHETSIKDVCVVIRRFSLG